MPTCNPRRLALGALAAAFALTLAACSPYTLHGKVIEGDISYVAVVDASDARLAGPGVGSATLELISNPARLNHKVISSGISGPDGEFDLRVEEVGAGLLTYDTSLTARRAGYSAATNVFKLPPDSKRVLVILKRGAGGKAPANESLIDEAKRYRP